LVNPGARSRKKRENRIAPKRTVVVFMASPYLLSALVEQLGSTGILRMNHLARDHERY
jgi:hypothetical protein